MPAYKLLDRAGGETHNFKPLSFPDGSYFVAKNIEQGYTAVHGEEGFFEYQHIRFEIVYESQHYLASRFHGFMRSFLFVDHFDSMVDESLGIQTGCWDRSFA